jgi:ketosteroid isomerase-like protein
VNKREPNAIAAVVGWIGAMRRGDLQAVARWFDPQVTWRCVPDAAIYRNRDDVRACHVSGATAAVRAAAAASTSAAVVS